MRIRDKPAWVTIAIMLVIAINGITLCTAVSDGSMNDTLNRSDETLMHVYDGATINVPDDYMKIQWAVDNASAGDTVIVRDGTYTENVDVNKPYANIRGGADAQIYYSFQDLNGGLITNEEKAYSHLYEIMDKYKDFKEFYVYFDKSASINHYIPSGWMGDADDIMYENRNQLRFLESYESTPTFDSDYTAWTYDNALALLAFIARGNATDKARAQILADSFLYVQNNDQTFNDGRVRDGYWATDIKDPSGKNSSIKSPGSGTGNMAWTMIALLQYYEVSKNGTYLEAAKRLGNWIHDNCNDIRGAGGYTGGYEDKNFDWELEKITWKSTEHNIDAYVAFLKLYNLTGNTTWLDRAIHANKFVKAMWNECEGHFWTGTKEDGVTLNEELLPEDVNTWGLMALGNPNKYGGGIRWVEKNCSMDPCPRGCGCDGVRFKGFDCDDDKDGIWFEGTAHTCIAYQIMNETDNSSKYISELRRAQNCANNSNGKGIVAACHDGVTCCHWEFPNALHIGATSWYIFAERKYNPFWGINTSDQIPCPPPIIWYVDDDGGAGIDFTKIQDAVDAANDGDIIIVNSGTYYENVNVTKQLILMGVDTGSGKPVVDAGDGGSAITLSANGITLDGFTVTNSVGWSNAGIEVTSNNNIITGNDASNNYFYGIYLWSSSNNTITGNTASNNIYDGIHLRDSSNNNIITGNNANNSNDGIHLYSSSNNTVTGNNVSNSDFYGIHLYSSSSNTITGNTFVNDGLFVYDSYQNTVEINTVNSKPLVYLENTSDIEVTDAGQVILVNCTNITVENLNLSNTSVGVELLQTEDSLISNNTASNNNYGIYLRYSSSNNITGNTVGNNRYNGILLWHSSSNIITGNDAINNNWCGIFASSSSNNNTITGNTFVTDGLFVFLSYQNTVEENIVNGKPLVYLEDVVDYKFEEAGQVILVNCNNITVENLNLSNTRYGVELLQTEDSLISNNTVSNNIDGIYLWSSSSNTITGNNASNNRYGIELGSSSNNTITGNNASNNNWGIYIGSSSNNTVKGNTASNNNDCGIGLGDSGNNNISGNNASNNRHGIWIRSSSNNNISGNTASNNNDCGIHLRYSDRNNIYLNNFIDNTGNVYSYNSTNIWNSTEKITYTYGGSTHTNYMGNYWSDYNEKYPGAEELDETGIWDTPYSIDPDADNHPLMARWENYFAPIETIFDTGSPAEPYPSISGTHNGTITLNQTITVSKLYTYPCVGTGGHTEYARIWNSILKVTATWDGYKEDGHNISFNESFTLVAGETYNYTIRTGSYPQIHHTDELKVDDGIIRCTEFKDANGKIYKDWIPAIRLTIG